MLYFGSNSCIPNSPWRCGKSMSTNQLHADQLILLYDRVAAQALRQYDLPRNSVELQALTSVNNATFKIIARATGGASQVFALRIHRPGSTTEDYIGAEIQWLLALRRDTTLRTPQPVQTNSGAWVGI